MSVRVTVTGIDGEHDRRPSHRLFSLATSITPSNRRHLNRKSPMPPTTDYIRHAARLARKIQLDAALGGTPAPDVEFYKTLAKAFEEIAAGLELVAKRE
jgi:hypothetical protein